MGTRAQGLGVNPRSLISKTRRKLAIARRHLANASALWCDVYGGVENDIEELIQQLDRIDDESMKDAAEYLAEDDVW